MEQNQEEDQDKHSEPAKVFDNNKTPPSQLQNKGCLIFSRQNFGYSDPSFMVFHWFETFNMPKSWGEKFERKKLCLPMQVLILGLY